MNAENKLDALVALLARAPDEVFLQPHNVPDPDAIASCAGLRYLLEARGVRARTVYDREIEKSDSLKMFEVFGIEMTRSAEAKSLGPEDWAILVDGQKGAGNLTDLPCQEVGVIDHHEWLGERGYEFADVRPDVGSCSAIVAEYFFDNGVEPPTRLATALLFGIMKDTDSLTRGVSDLDMTMFFRLYRHSDMTLVKSVNGSQLKLRDLELFSEAFKSVECWGPLAFVRLDCPDDSLLGAAGDIVLSLDTAEYVVAYSVRDSGVKLSVRSESPPLKANALVRAIVEGLGAGGGHDHMAGGFIPSGRLPDDRKVDTLLRHRAIAFVEAALASP
jgi:nanoRNase/pAp phosphatase (c-di-AMP/oligoRNAs hydrolase)